MKYKKSLLFIEHFETYLTIDNPLSDAADWYTREKNQKGVRPLNFYLQNRIIKLHDDDGNGYSPSSVISLNNWMANDFDGTGPSDDIESTVARGNYLKRYILPVKSSLSN